MFLNDIDGFGSGSIQTIATPAQRFLCAVGDWAATDNVRLVSRRARVMDAYFYKYFVARFGDKGNTAFVLAASSNDTVELNSIISYPDRRGHGTVVMERLCTLADECGVRLWLDACPYGRNHEHISIRKLLAFYQGFGFFPVAKIDRRWISGYHLWDKYKFRHPMIRNAQLITAEIVPARLLV